MRPFSDIKADILAARSASDAQALLSLANEMRALQTTPAEAEAEHALAAACRITGDLALASEHFNRALALHSELGNRRGIADVRYALGWIDVNLGQALPAIEQFRRAIELFEEEDHLPGIVSSVAGIADCYRTLDDYPRALEHLHQALVLEKKQGMPHGSGALNVSLGNMYWAMHDYATAIQHFQRALDRSTDTDAGSVESTATAGMGAALSAIGRYDEALSYLQRAKTLAVSRGDKAGLTSVVEAEIDAHLGRRDVIAAEAGLLEQAELIKAFPDSRTTYLTQRGQLHELRGDMQAAADAYREALNHAEADGNRSRAVTIHLLMRDLAQKQTDFASYVHHNSEYLRIKEEIAGKGATQKLAMLEAEHRMEEERRVRDKERALLYGTLPREVADRMIRGETVNDQFEAAAVLFADIVGFTSHSSEMSASDVSALLEDLYRRFDDSCKQHGVVKVKTIGDSYLCFKGDDTAEVNALAIANVARDMIAVGVKWPSGEPLSIRVGVHLGPVSAGVIGTERLQYDIWGDTVNVASRMESTGEPGRIHVSESTADALRSLLPALRERGNVEVKGKGAMTTYWLEGAY